jgi:hypothetical protein
MGAVGAENRSYEMQIAQKYPEGDGVGPNARRLAYGKSATALTVQHPVSGGVSLSVITQVTMRLSPSPQIFPYVPDNRLGLIWLSK